MVACATTPASGPSRLSTQKIKSLDYAVFEIVVPKKDEKAIAYVGNKPLPVEELPFSERNDKYYSIGTAFALQRGRLVSAAHVFELDRLSISHEYFVRDRKGKVYPVDKIVRYSQYRDLVEFTIAGAAPKIAPLKIGKRAVVGDTVYSVGNANGEGIAVRNGQIASFTFEPIDGKWKDIRFSAPASPGNSGGPLLNAKGEVLGVVVRKNESENLNVAVPIAELARLSGKTAEFFVSSSEANRDGEPTKDWRFQAPVPATVDRLAVKAEADQRRFHLKQWSTFLTENRDGLFPLDSRLNQYFWDQTYAHHMQVLSYNDKKGYHLEPKEPLGDQETSWGEVVYTLVDEPDYSVVQIDMAPGAQHAEYIKRPERLLDAIIQAYAVYREFNGRKIPIKTLGPPVSAGSFVDILGRPWLKAVWRTHFNQGSFLLNCLPGPLGFGCVLDLIETADETLGGQEKFERFHAAEVQMSYWGDVRSWQRFLALPKRWLPRALAGMRVERPGNGRVALTARDLNFAYAQPLYSDKSWLFVGMGYGLASPLAPEIQFVKLEHGPQFKVSEEFELVAEPLDSSTSESQQWWAGLVGRKGRFDGSPLDDKGLKRVYKVLDVKPNRKGRKVARFASCDTARPEALPAIQATCRSIVLH
jgi:hypothetical protein